MSILFCGDTKRRDCFDGWFGSDWRDCGNGRTRNRGNTWPFCIVSGCTDSLGVIKKSTNAHTEYDLIYYNEDKGNKDYDKNDCLKFSWEKFVGHKDIMNLETHVCQEGRKTIGYYTRLRSLHTKNKGWRSTGSSRRIGLNNSKHLEHAPFDRFGEILTGRKLSTIPHQWHGFAFETVDTNFFIVLNSSIFLPSCYMLLLLQVSNILDILGCNKHKQINALAVMAPKLLIARSN